jgi:hypothetical protein
LTRATAIHSGKKIFFKKITDLVQIAKIVIKALTPQWHLHPAAGDDVPDVRDHGLGEDLVDEDVVADVAGVGDVLHAQAVI